MPTAPTISLLKQLNLLLLLLILPMVSVASDAINLSEAKAHQTGTHWRYVEAPILSPDEVESYFNTLLQQHSAWQTSQSEDINFGFKQHGYWLTLSITAATDLQWMLWNHYSLIDLAVLYQCPAGARQAELCTVVRGGDRIPFSERIIDHPNLILPLQVPPGDTTSERSYDLYLYVATEGTYQLPIEILDLKTLNQKLMNNNLIRGAYFAVMLAMGLYNLVLFFTVRDKIYLYYSGFVVSFLFFHLNFEGSAYGYFWPDQPDWNGVMMPLSFAITQFFFSIFLPNFLDLKKYAPAAATVYRIYTPVTVLFMVLSFVAPYQYATSVQNLTNALLAVYTLIVAIRVWRLGHEPARLFTFAWIAFIFGVVSGNASTLGILPGNSLILHGYQLGSVFDVVLISLAMGTRINQLTAERSDSQRRLSESQAQAISYLKQYEDLYKNSIAGRFQLNSKGVITGCNPALARILGFPDEEALLESDAHFDQFIESPDASVELWELLEQERQIQSYELTLMPRRGQPVQAILTMRKEPSENGVTWIGSLLDITEKYQREQEVRRLEMSRDLSLSQLVMGISHEMNTPLGNIRLANSHLQARLNENKDSMTEGAANDSAVNFDIDFIEATSHVTENIERLATLNDLMQSSLGETRDYRPESIYIKHWLRDWKQRADERLEEVDIEVISSPDSSLWHGFAEVLDDILMQLVDNSVFHNPEQAERGELYIRVSAALTDGVLNLQYQDNGKGVSVDDRERIFLPFFTTRRSLAKKKGLGLYQVQNHVSRLMKGKIEWPSVQRGFALTLLLPDLLATRNEPPHK